MNTIVCPVLPFPNIFWWSQCFGATKILLDIQEHFEKMSFRNKYMLASPNGIHTLTIPLKDGRQQRKPMRDVLIDNKSDWQQQHWKSLCSLYNRSPYFEFVKHDLALLFSKKFVYLIDFNLASIAWASNCLKLHLDASNTELYQKNYLGAFLDNRNQFRTNQYLSLDKAYKSYHQVFEDKVGFLPNLSIIDLICAEAKNSTLFLSL